MKVDYEKTEGNSIILFMVYYGKLPDYFDIWLKAVQNNHSVNFCIISDLIHDKKLSSNIKLVDISFSEFKQKIQNKFDFPISLNNYGRISQFRPALAYVFDGLVKGYNYWGFIECDLIPGNIRKFITDDILNHYDKVFKLGHFQIFKNNQKMNTLFMNEYSNALSYRFAFSKDVLFFEEILGMHNIATSAKCQTYEKNIFADIKCYELMFECSNYSYWEQAKLGKCLFSYEDGTLIRYTLNDNGKIEKDEILYVHLQKRIMKIETRNYNQYLIIPNSFVDKNRIDNTYFFSIMNKVAKRAEEYEKSIIKKFTIQKKERYKNIDWWIMRILRYRIRKNDGVDLNGK